MSVTVEMDCPKCGVPDSFTLEVSVDENYGADSDGRRGVRRVSVDTVTQECFCTLTEVERDELTDEAGERADDMAEDEDY